LWLELIATVLTEMIQTVCSFGADKSKITPLSYVPAKCRVRDVARNLGPRVRVRAITHLMAVTDEYGAMME
jgi:hypothetical protein